MKGRHVVNYRNVLSVVEGTSQVSKGFNKWKKRHVVNYRNVLSKVEGTSQTSKGFMLY